MKNLAKSRILALLTGAAVVFGSLTLSAPAFAEDDPTSSSSPSPEATPEATPTPEPSDTPAPTETPTPTPTPSDTPSAAATVTPEFVNYTGRVTRLSERDAQDVLESAIQLFTVPGSGYLRIDISQLELGSSLFDKVTLRFAVPAGLQLSDDPDEAFRQLAQASTDSAPLVAVERVIAPSRARAAAGAESLGTQSLINMTPATSATHKIYAVLVTPASGAASASAEQTAAKVQTSVTHADSYWAAQSSGLVHFQLAGTVPWYHSANTCTTDAGNAALWNEASNLAASQFGFEGAMNEHVVLFFPTGTACGGGIGLGTIGYSVNSGGAAWVMGTDLPISQATLAHELGHNMSLGHASWSDCSTNDPHPGFLGDVGCSYEPYGDATDVMGYGTGGADGGALSSPSAIRSGLWSSSAYFVAPLGTTSYTLNSVSSHSGKRAVIVEDADGVNYFVEFRDFANEDAQFLGYGCYPEACVAPAANVRVLRMEQQVFNDGTYDYLFKGYPGDDSLIIGRNNGASDSVGYTAGQSFKSASPEANGITVSVTSITGSTATVSVTKRSNALNGSYVTVVPTLTKDNYLRVGDTLTAFLEADWTADAFAFQWYRVSGSNTATAIPGATGQNYVLTSADQNQYLRVRATGSVGGSSAYAIDPDPYYYYGYGPVSGGVLEVGTVTIDASLPAFHAVLAGWNTPGTTFTYQWKRNGVNIAGATAANYTPTAADRDQVLRVWVRGSKPGYSSETAESLDADYTLYATGTATVSGTRQVGQTLSLNSLSYTTVGGVPASPTVTYQWYRAGVAIAGATAQSYALVAADYNAVVTAKLTATLAGTIPYTQTTLSVGTIIKGTIAISGASPVVTIDPTSLTPSATSVKLNAAFPAGALTEPGVTQTYVWKRGTLPGVAIAGATAASYTLTAADYGQPISVTIAVTKLNYDSIAARQSSATNYSIIATGALDVAGERKVGSYLYPGYLDYTVASGPVSPNLSYQWYRAGLPIAGPAGTATDYLLTASDYNLAISVRITASLPGFQSIANTSTPTAAIQKGDIQGALTAPVVTKNSATLLTSALPVGSVTESGVSYTRQWFRGAAAIAGATGVSYQLVAADAGQNVSVKWTVAKLNYTSVVLASAPVNYTVQASTPPVISGSLAVGQVLDAITPPFVTVDGPVASPTLSYQWLRNGAAIAGALGSSYTLLAADYNTMISVKLTAATPGYLTGSSTSVPTAAIAKGVILGDHGLPVVTATGTAAVTLSAALPAGSVTEPGTTKAYQWFRGAIAIVGGTAATYPLVVTDYGYAMSVRVTVTKLNYTNVVLTSTPINFSVLSSGPPTITGTLAVGNTLTAVPPNYTIASGPTPGSEVYQWYRNGMAIAGATASTYALVAVDYNTALSVKISTALPGYQQSVRTSLATTPIAKGVIGGTHTVPVVTTTGPSTLMADIAPDSITEPGAVGSNQWFRGTVAIPGATGQYYTLTAADWGKLISVRATATKLNYTTVVLSSVGVDYSLIPSDPLPVLTGVVADGYTLSVEPRTYWTVATEVTTDPLLVVSYAWYRSGVVAPVGTSATYNLSSADLGKTITVKVTASLPGYVPSVSTSAATQAIGASSFTPWDSVVGVSVGNNVLLTASILATPAPTTTAYQWFRGASAIAGATGAAYQSTAADYGQYISVRVTISKVGFTTMVKTSTPTKHDLIPTGLPSLAGAPRVGGSVSLDIPPNYQAGGSPASPSFTHQWLRNGAVIAGATGSSYTPVSADYGTSLSLRLTAHVDQYLDVARTSPGVTISKGIIQGYDPPTVVKADSPLKLTASLPVGGSATTGVAIGYQWMRGATPIAGQTATSYTPTAADLNQLISVKVTVTKTNYDNVVLQSPGVNYTVYPLFQPTIDPVSKVGEIAHATPPPFETSAGAASPTLSWTWLRNGVAIPGATTADYPLVAADYGKVITVRVTGALLGYLAGSSVSPPTVSIQKGVIQGSFAPVDVSVNGTFLATSSLPAGAVTESGVAYTRQWYRGASAIAGATGANYQLTAADYGQGIKVIWTVTKLNYTTATLSSVTADFSVAASPAVPTITGTVAQGQTLSIDGRDYFAGGSMISPTTVTYQWYRTGIAVAGALGTGPSYVLTAADLGKTITVKMTVGSPNFLPSISTSAATQAVGASALAGWDAAPTTVDVSKNTASPPLLTAGLTGITESGVTRSFQWFRGTMAIPAPAGTAATYQTVAADYGQNVWVRLTTSKVGFTSTVQTSVPTNYSLSSNVTPEISGTLRVGEVLSTIGASYSTVDDGAVAPDSITYQWYRAGVAIPGATSSTYTISAADYTKALTVKVTGTKAGFIPGFRTSVPTALVPKGIILGSLTAPTVTEDLGLRRLTVDSMTVSGSVSEPGAAIAFQWFRGAVAIPGATSASYNLAAADFGQTIFVKATITKLNYNTVVLNSTATNYSVTTAGTPAITGTLRVGATLTSVTPAYTTSGGGVSPTFLYQWLRNGVAIAGAQATGATYDLVAADYNTAIAVRVTPVLSGYLAVAKNSPNTAMVAKGVIAGDLGVPSITKPAGSLVLTIDLPSSSITELGVTKTYQWFRGAAAIAGQTGITYTLAAADYGFAVSARVTVAKLNYTTVVLNSVGTDYSISTPGVPAILGQARVGETISTWTPAYSLQGAPTLPDFTYQWLRNGAPIAGATGIDFALTAVDYGKTITVRVTASLPGYLGVIKTSFGSPSITAGLIGGSYALPVVVEDPVGLLTASLPVGSITEPGVGYSYQWYRNGVPIPLATASTYALTGADNAQPLNVRVTATKLNYGPAAMHSTPVVVYYGS